MEWLILLSIGVGAGVAGGLFGIGGGIIVIPALMLLLPGSFPTQHKAQGTSLVALLAPVGLLALMKYYREGNADLVAGAWIAGGFLGGAYFGSLIAFSTNDQVLRKVFAVFLGGVAVYLFFRN
jgi:uncharacterized membrane protein YfcA